MKLLNARFKKRVVYEIIDELIEKIESCQLINDQKDQLIDDPKDECCEIIKHKNVEIIEHQKTEDINMLKLSIDNSKRLNPLKKELRVIARERGVKNYENLSKRELIKEINKLKAATGPKKITFEKYKGDDLELKIKDIRKGKKRKKKILLAKKKDMLKRLDLKKKGKRYLKLKKLLRVYH